MTATTWNTQSRIKRAHDVDDDVQPAIFQELKPMTQTNGTQQANPYGFTEAPASINFRFTHHGYTCQLTLRDATGIGVIEKLDSAIQFLEKRGVVPAANGHSTNGNESTPTCPDHNKPMKASKFGGWYCPVSVGEHPQTGEKLYCTHKIDE